MSNRNATVTVNTKANTGGLKQVSGALTSFDSGLKGALGNLKQFKGALGALAVVGIAKGIKSFADDMRNAYMVQAKAEKSVNDALYSNMTARGESQQAIDDQVKAYKGLASQLQKVGVIGDEVTLSGMGIMTQMGLTTDQVKTMTPLLQDLAVKQFGLNVSTDQYKEMSRSVATMVNMGKLTLQGYGIQVTDVERKQFKAMSQSERYAFIMNKLKNSVAGANEALAQTAGGKMQQMNNAIGDCEEQVGKLVNTLYGGFATMVLPLIEQATGAFQELIGIMSDDQSTGFEFFTQDQANTIAGIRDGLSQVWENLKTIFDLGFDFGENFGITDALLGLINNIVWAVNTLTNALATAKNAVTSFINSSSNIKAQAEAAGVDTNYLDWNATGTNYFQGGLTHVNENGGEIMSLPNGTQIIPHDISTKIANNSGSNNVTVNVNVAGNVIGNQDFIDQVGDAISGRVSMAIANM